MSKKPKQLDIFQLGQEDVGLEKHEVLALQCCYAGEATPGQQRLAIDTIIDKIALTDRMVYQPGSFDETAFLAGRSFVGKATRITLQQKVTKEKTQ